MTIRNLAILDRDICQPLGRIIQEAFADGFIGTGSINMVHTIPAAALGTSWDGIYRFKTILDGVATSLIVGTHIGLKFTNNARICLPGISNSALTIQLTSSGTPNLDGGNVSGLNLEYYVNESGGAPRDAYALHAVADVINDYRWDGLLQIQNAGDLGDSDHAGGAGKVVGFDGDTDIIKIPVKIAGSGTPYYFLVGQGMAEVNSD